MPEFPTLPELLRHHARIRPDAIALSFEGRSTSYADLDRHTDQIANGLIARRLPDNAHVAYLGKNADLYFELMLGCAKAHLLITPINWRLAPAEMAQIMRDCEAPVLFYGREFEAVAQMLERECPALRAI